MSRPRLTTVLLPTWIAKNQLQDSTAVVIDIVRASTTIVHALANAAAAVTPCVEVEEARQRARNLSELGRRVLLGGERGGIRVDGFDLGNSPTEYTRSAVAGRSIIFSTTNGTRAIDACLPDADEIVIGCFANLSRLTLELAAKTNVALVCAGADGQVSREDVLFAGAVATSLVKERDWEIDDATRIAIQVWRSADQAALALELADTQGGRNLRRIGQDADLETAATIDSHPILPRYRNGQIVCPLENDSAHQR